MKMVERVETTARQYPGNVSYQFMGKKTTYDAFVKQIDTAARALTALGIAENDVVSIAMPNMPQAIILLYAANKIGAVVNMIHPLSSENEYLDFLTRVQAKAVLVLDQFYPVIEKIRSQTVLQTVIVAGVAEVLGPLKKAGYLLTQGKKYRYLKKENKILRWNRFMQLSADCVSLPVVSDRSNETALILHSGGTTGKSKGVCLSNESVNISAKQMIDANPLHENTDRFLSVMPIFHGNGLVIGIHAMQMIGARCVLIPRFTPESYAKDLLKHKCNYMSGVPILYEKLIAVDVMQKADLSFLKGVFCGADYLSAELEQKINAFLTAHHSPVPVRQGYGMTEGVVCTTVNPANEQRIGSIGKPMEGVDVKIVEPGTERELAAGEIGEIVFSAATNMLGYYNDPEETAQTLRKHADGQYWVHSGDLGSMDEDGYFYFKGRTKRMLTINGYNVFPNELENVIDRLDMVERSCVVGVQHTEGAQRVKAFVVLKKGYDKTEEMKREIVEQCRPFIAKYALPKEIEFIDEMPKTKVGKIDVNALLAGK